MSCDARVSELLARWQELRDRGSPVAAEELCRESPELLDELRRELKAHSTPGSGPQTPSLTGSSAEESCAVHCPTVPGYEILEELGHGGMGIVYRARDCSLGRVVALKMLLAGPWANSELRERFRREARAMAHLDHPHVVTIFGEGECAGQPYFTMKWVSGGDLAQQQPRLHGDMRAGVALMEKVARAVHFLHEHKILHRDLKPLNILLSEDGEPHVTDFGLAKFLEEDKELTHTSEPLGTPAYMAPEQIEGRRELIGPATDVWALGVMLYELLCGRRPFRADSRSELALQIVSADPPGPRTLRPDLSRALEAVVLKCLDKDPGRRFGSAGELAEDLDRWLRDEPPVTRPPSLPGRAWRWVRRRPLVVGAFALLAVLAVLGLLLMDWLDPARPVRLMRQELARGRPVELIDAKGKPRWERWPLGEPGSVWPGGGPGVVTVQSAKRGVLELLPDPGLERYRFRAEVRHEGSGTTEKGSVGEVGIYCALASYAHPQGEFHTFCTWTFNDLILKPQSAMRPGNPIEANLYLYGADGPNRPKPINHHRGFGPGPLFFAPSLQWLGQRPWRQLEVEVTPAVLRFRWEQTGVREVSREGLIGRGQGVLTDNAQQVGKSAFRLGHSLGLYCEDSVASFRHVVVEPLAGEP